MLAESVDTAAGRVVLVHKNRIRVEIRIGADSQLAEDRRRKRNSHIAHLERVREEVITCREIELVDELDLL